MTSVTRIGGGGAAARGGTRFAASGFRLPEAQAAATPAASPVMGTGAMLGLEAPLTPAERDDLAQRRGGALLDELARLQRDLLRGAPDAARLRRLATLTEGEAGHNPSLREAMEAIALRVRVELAKLAPAASGQAAPGA